MCFGKKKNNNSVKPPQSEGELKKKETEKKKNPALGVFYFISVVFTFTMAYLIIWPLQDRTSELNISLTIPSDSLMAISAVKDNITQLNCIIDELNERNKEIDEKYELFIKSGERDSNFIRLISAIAAFIVTLLGFLGYRTIKDIQDRVESSAKDQAEKTSKQITEDVMSVTVERKLNTMVSNSVAGELIRSQIMEKINKEIASPLENRIDTQKRNLDLLSMRVGKLENPSNPVPVPNSANSENVTNEEPTPSLKFQVPSNEE